LARILLTAGPTRAYIDDVRYLTNGSSGRMAAAIARAALAAGHEVTIVSGPVAVLYPPAARLVPVVSTGDMMAACLAELPRCDGVIAAAAPCDFEPEKKEKGKIPRRGSGLTLKLLPTPDIIATLARKAGPRQWMVAFALEPGADPKRAFEKIDAKGCDLIVVNDLSAVNAGSTAVAVYDASHAKVGERRGTKLAVAAWLVRLIATRCSTPAGRRTRARGGGVPGKTRFPAG
jgi:phosphopantothenoylcysteine decarboxylase/phosphopantothenate--cysteine ligase